ncbi:hypothetical protein D3C80_2166450 [compost metagenome]
MQDVAGDGAHGGVGLVDARREDDQQHGVDRVVSGGHQLSPTVCMVLLRTRWVSIR